MLGAAAPAAPANPRGHHRLAYLVSRYPAVSHTFIAREVAALRARGFDIEVASINPPDRAPTAMLPAERAEAARTYCLKRHGLRGAVRAHLAGFGKRPLGYLKALAFALSLGHGDLNRHLFGFFYFTEALMLARWLEQQQRTHLHVHFASAAANVALILKRYQPIGLSLTVHGPDEFYDVHRQWLPEKLAAANFVLCIGQYARSQLMLWSPPALWPRFEISPLGVDAPPADAPQARRSARPFTVLCVGRMAPAKGQRVLVEAVGQLRAAGRTARLVLVGDGVDTAALRARVHQLGLDDHVNFRGALNEREVQACYRDADAFALASFAEGIPVVLMEAMANGLPCVSTRITGIPELIRDGRDGLLVPPSDAGALAAALARLADDPALRQRLGEAGRQRVRAAYDLSRNADRLAGILDRRLGAQPC